MKIKNNLVLFFSFIGFLLGMFDSFMAYDEEIQMIFEYSSNYNKLQSNLGLFLYLFFRYFKYILLIYFFSVGYLNKIVTVVIAMVKSYFYIFCVSLIFKAFDGLTLFVKLLTVFSQMTMSLIITVFFAQVIMNCIEGQYEYHKKTVISFLAFVFSFFCCIIIALIDFTLIKLVL